MKVIIDSNTENNSSFFSDFSWIIFIIIIFFIISCDKVNSQEKINWELEKTKSTFRVLLISDVHYSTEDRLGYTQQERMEIMIKNILKEHHDKPITTMLLLGDMSIDDYGYRNLSDNFCKKLKDEYLDRLPFPVYFIPGNHDSYPEHIWFEEMGLNRQYTVSINDVIFIMLDTFNDTATSASGAVYTPINTQWLSKEISIYEDKPIFLCAHHFDWNKESVKFKEILTESGNIVALFSGHTHAAKVMQLNNYGNKYHFDIGCFSYYTKPTNGKWDFDHFHPNYAWGYQILDFTQDKVTTYHKMIPMHYMGSNIECQVEEQRSQSYQFNLKIATCANHKE